MGHSQHQMMSVEGQLVLVGVSGEVLVVPSRLRDDTLILSGLS